MADPLYPESAAYHEAGHVVIAAVLGLRLSPHGMHLDAEGRGMSYYRFRKPESWTRSISSDSPEISAEDTIVATMAGLIAQKKFYPDCSPNGASDDDNIVDMLLGEMYPDDIIGYSAVKAPRTLQKLHVL